MFRSTKEKLLLGFFILLIILVPVGSYLIRQRIKASNSNIFNYNKTVTKESTSSAKRTGSTTNLTTESTSKTNSLDPIPSSDNPSAQLSFGPTLNFKIKVQGRPVNQQAAKVFLGIVQGTLSSNPKYLLSFMIDVPDNGVYTNLSLIGLDQGSDYTTVIKGPAQIASASAFTVKPTFSDIGILNLLTGDLNEDNVINTSDYSIARAALGTTVKSSNWNDNIDFNLDGIINTFDLAVLVQNIGKIGASGPWQSTPSTKTATSSAGMVQAFNATTSGRPQGGYWLWIPQF